MGRGRVDMLLFCETSLGYPRTSQKFINHLEPVHPINTTMETGTGNPEHVHLDNVDILDSTSSLWPLSGRAALLVSILTGDHI